MKTVLSIFLSLIVISGVHADDKYESAMRSNLEKIGTAQTPNDYIKIANNFERIALAEKEKWLPYYYSAFCYTLANYSDTSNTRKEIYLDKAVAFLQTADSLEQNNSEIFTLMGMIAQARMQIDSMNRWMKYGAEAENSFRKAMEIDPTNPRPEYLIGIGLFYTPQQFGGGPVPAKPILERSLEKYNSFIPQNDLMPDWGREMVEQLLKQIIDGDQ
ncbi:MAG: hypothetical protein R6W68_01205 [Ignavibacteriaceae bacterium]